MGESVVHAMRLADDVGAWVHREVRQAAESEVDGDGLRSLYSDALAVACALLQRSSASAEVKKFLRRWLNRGGVCIVRGILLGICPEVDPSFASPDCHGEVLEIIKAVFSVCDEENVAWDDELVDVFQNRGKSLGGAESGQAFCKRVFVHARNGGGDDEGGVIQTQHVSIRCSKNMLQGNTGCFCWEAAFVLYEYLLRERQDFEGKSCLELGAGCGLLGVGLERAGAKRAVLTDANEETLKNLELNLALNGIRSSPLREGEPGGEGEARSPSPEGEDGRTATYCGTLDWQSDFDCGPTLDFDVVLGSDITYDSDLIPSLVAFIDKVLSRKRGARAYIAAVPRNPATLEMFVREVAEKGMSIEDLVWKPSPSFWRVQMRELQEVRLFRISVSGPGRGD